MSELGKPTVSEVSQKSNVKIVTYVCKTQNVLKKKSELKKTWQDKS